ncbi:response regulator [Sphingobium sp. TA15]|uniref:CheY-like response regulator n=1 Tax=Sphingobium indicum (strain DSM 16413 / CCM 7287 / MTCC 6362 / UT26 / NBRC 101211 / UT26S) TaxID=452662 RepID=D4Z024_SPHIU|nr:response regulator [Sphingobium indicum]BAI95956.1 CheY-like response regulator [Sphingobium indicum UT26S]BDD65269.1 response regulator [Sphingobium sp. TA15]
MDDTALAAQTVLIVEDDYYLAFDTADALRDAGAGILGPFPTEEKAMDAIRLGRPSAAVLDINLGNGPSFRLARLLKERGVPFLFLTGYDEEVIPSDLNDALRLQKPIAPREIVASLAWRRQGSA